MKKAKPRDPRQSSLFDLGTDPSIDTVEHDIIVTTVEVEPEHLTQRLSPEEFASAMARLTLHQTSVKVDLAGPQMNYRQCLVEQIVRDRQTLMTQTEFAPSKQFFEERIVAYTASLHKWDATDWPNESIPGC